MLKNLKLELASLDDLEDIAHIYEDIHTDLEQTVNYPRWPKGIYPTIHSAKQAIEKQEMFVLRSEPNDWKCYSQSSTGLRV